METIEQQLAAMESAKQEPDAKESASQEFNGPNPYVHVLRLFKYMILATLLTSPLFFFDGLPRQIGINIICFVAIIGIFLTILMIIRDQYKYGDGTPQRPKVENPYA